VFTVYHPSVCYCSAYLSVLGSRHREQCLLHHFFQSRLVTRSRWIFYSEEEINSVPSNVTDDSLALSSTGPRFDLTTPPKEGSPSTDLAVLEGGLSSLFGASVSTSVVFLDPISTQHVLRELFDY
jgi:hypothetical protein